MGGAVAEAPFTLHFTFHSTTLQFTIYSTDSIHHLPTFIPPSLPALFPFLSSPAHHIPISSHHPLPPPINQSPIHPPSPPLPNPLSIAWLASHATSTPPGWTSVKMTSMEEEEGRLVMLPLSNWGGGRVGDGRVEEG